jgi:hypothetical protein
MCCSGARYTLPGFENFNAAADYPYENFNNLVTDNPL